MLLFVFSFLPVSLVFLFLLLLSLPKKLIFHVYIHLEGTFTREAKVERSIVGLGDLFPPVCVLKDTLALSLHFEQG